MIIDSHCHVYPDKIAEKASGATGNFYDIGMCLDGKVSTLIEAGKQAGIDKYIIQSVATTPKQVGSINRFIADTVKEHSDIMYGLGTLHPDSEDMEGDVRNVVELGLKGVKLHPDIQGFKLDDYRCLKIYELCEKNGLAVLLHTGDKRYDFSNPNRLIPILDIYENLTVIGAHFGGWSIWEKATDILHGRKNFYVDCSSSFYSLDDDTIVKLIRVYGVDNVVFGTDYPMWDPKSEVDRLKSLPLTDEEKEKIFWKNAVRIYNL
ncbi:MAG: amidohydrolase family protein [Clostridia bacterium]|nr:amidohydrolase family protein [Clostridia bacterium]